MGQIYKILFSVIILKISAIHVTNANYNQYCNIRSCPNPLEHTLCRYKPGVTKSSQCGDSLPVVGLTNEEKQQLLNLHNNARRHVALGFQVGKFNQLLPAAVHMPPLTWDTELELIAQTWANQCNTVYNPHDKCRDVDRYQVGQNAVYSFRTMYTVEEQFDGLYQEAAFVDANLIHQYRNVAPKFAQRIPPTTWGHYTTIIWAKTTKIGCGKTRYYLNNEHHEWLVCNYGPAGSIPGQEVYQTYQSRG